MSTLRVTNLKGGSAGSAPNLPDGAVITGVATVGVLSATTFYGSGANLTGIDATALKDSGGSVKIQANSDGAIVTGVITATTVSATTGSFTSNVSVGGTLTYEDVTNIDSVGVITARSGIVATGVVTATSFSGSGANLTGIDPAPTVTATADGAITAGDSVILKSDGTVTKTKETYSAVSPIGGFSSGDVNIPNSSDETSEWQTCKIKDNYMLAAYKRGNGSNTVRIRQVYIQDGGAATVSSNEGNISDSGSYIVDAAHDPDRDQAVILYLKSDNKLYVRTVRSTGTTSLTWGNEVAVATNAGQSAEGSVFLSYDPTSSKFLIVYAKDPDNSSYATAQTMTVVDNNTYTFGSKVTFKSNTCTNAAVSYDSTAGKHLIVYRDDSISNDSYGIVATVSGTNVSFGSAVELETGDNKASKLAYSTTDNKHIWMYNDETGSRLDVSALTVSGTSVSRGAVSTITVAAPSALNDGSITAAYDPTLNKFYLLYPNNYVGKMSPATLSGTSVTLGTETNSRLGNGVADVDLAYDSSTNRFLFVLQNGATNAGLYQIWHTSNAATNLTGENYIGIARNTVADTATATIDVSGATNISQSSLTPGQNYFVQNNGTLGLTGATPKVYAGTAVSATQLLVGKQSDISEGMSRLGGGSFTGSSSTVEMFDAFTSDYLAYKVVFNFTNSAGDFGVRLGTASAWKTSGYWHQSCFSDGGSAEMGGGSNSWARFNSNSKMGAGELMIIDPTSTAQGKITYFQGFSSRNATPNNQTQFGGRGSILDTTDVITKAQWISEGDITYIKWVLYGIK